MIAPPAGHRSRTEHGARFRRRRSLARHAPLGSSTDDFDYDWQAPRCGSHQIVNAGARAPASVRARSRDVVGLAGFFGRVVGVCSFETWCQTPLTRSVRHDLQGCCGTRRAMKSKSSADGADSGTFTDAWDAEPSRWIDSGRLAFDTVIGGIHSCQFQQASVGPIGLYKAIGRIDSRSGLTQPV